MSGTPKYKAFRGKEYIAAFKYAHDVAVLISAEVVNRVSYDRAVWVWKETDDPSIAANSYDDAAEIMEKRLSEHQIKTLWKMGYLREDIIENFNHNRALVDRVLS
jgi:adenine-specific DNA methylase